MGQETGAEFERRWMETAESEVESANRKFFIWLCVFIAATAACFSVERFLPRSGGRAVAVLLLLIPSLISFVGVALSSSSLGDAKRFLRECRNGLSNEVEGIR
jgi:hypothetical protein